MLSVAPSPILTFEKVLRAFGTGGFTYADVVVQLERLLAIGASPTAMLEALQRRERIEPFPEYAHVEVVRLLNAAIAKSANEALISGEQSEPDEAQDQSPDSVLAEDAPEPHRSQRRDLDAASAESIALRDTLAARDATIAQVLNSLGERDAQLAELQQQHAKVVSMLEARAGAGTQLGADLRALQARSATLAAELATARAALQSEQNKSRGFDKAWAESLASNEAARSRADEALLEAKRYQNDSRALRDTLVAREAAIAQLKHSLAERDAQLAALQQEHAKIVPILKARADAGAQLGAELPAARMRADAIGLELKASKEAAALLSAQLTRSESGLNAARRELGALKTQLNSQLELLRSRDWQRGFDQNLCQELDTRAQAAEAALAAAAAPVPGAGIGGQGVSARPVRRLGQRWTSIARPVMAGVAVAVMAVAAWFLVQHASAPKEAPVAAAAAVPEPGTVIRDCPTCPAMVVLPRGRFKQGSLRAESGATAFETPLHWVAIGPLSMSSNAVTVDDFQQFIADTGSDMRGCDTYDGDWKRRPDSSWRNPGFSQTGTHPVTCVSWNDAKAYARWLSAKTGHSYRLPSASEWEYAARAGGEAVQPWSADGSAACATANVADASAAQRYPGWTVFGCSDGYVYTAPVGSFKANSFGLNDMLGNVFQWTEDCWHADYTGAPIDGSARSDGDCSEHELRGGSWFSTPAYVRANYRNHFAADYRTSSVGIRLVRDIAQ
jgi:formylglycine-generating enzyme required for sulfatase activity